MLNFITLLRASNAPKITSTEKNKTIILHFFVSKGKNNKIKLMGTRYLPSASPSVKNGKNRKNTGSANLIQYLRIICITKVFVKAYTEMGNSSTNAVPTRFFHSQ
ncbi:MAG: hypothetical protein EOO93_22905 [Pedobacter sp.]|nr:MAG: hypothetical protein EOO93_22905 [Pedobacter sp.]